MSKGKDQGRRTIFSLPTFVRIHTLYSTSCHIKCSRGESITHFGMLRSLSKFTFNYYNVITRKKTSLVSLLGKHNKDYLSIEQWTGDKNIPMSTILKFH